MDHGHTVKPLKKRVMNTTPYYYDSARELGKTVADYLRDADDNYVIIEDGEALKWSDNGHPVIYGDRRDAEADKQDATIITEREYIERYVWKDMTFEVCPHCGEEVALDAELKVQTCPNCGKRIVTCSVCMACDESGEYCKKCALCYQANAENGEKQDEPKNEPKGLYIVATEVVKDGMKKDGTGVELFATYANALRRYNEFVDGAIKANPNKPYGTQDTPKDGYREHNFELWREDEAFFCEHTSCTLTKMNVNE